jgi:hypothetical protein
MMHLRSLVFVLTLAALFALAFTAPAYAESFTATDLAAGQCRFEATFSNARAYVEIFIRKNGSQIFAGGIQANATQHPDGSWTYRHTQDGLRANDQIEYRFYSYAAGGAGVFSPGPGQDNWLTSTYTPPAESPSPTSLTMLSSGRARMTLTRSDRQAYVEIFVRKNGSQIFAGPITLSEASTASGFEYSSTLAGFAPGDRIEYRFYHYTAGGPGKFTPGSGPDAWLSGVYQTPVESPFLHVGDLGSDNNPGTASQPFRSITRALAAARDAGGSISEIRVAGGLYPEYGLSIVPGVSILGGYSSDFSQRNPATIISTIDADRGGRIFSARNITTPTTLDGFYVKNGSVSGTLARGGGCLYIEGCNASFVVSRVVFEGGQAIFGAVGGNIYMTGSSAVIRSNSITAGFTGGGLGGADIKIFPSGTSSSPEVSRNVFSNNGSTSGLAYVVDSLKIGNVNVDNTPHVPTSPW